MIGFNYPPYFYISTIAVSTQFLDIEKSPDYADHNNVHITASYMSTCSNKIVFVRVASLILPQIGPTVPTSYPF